MFLIPSILMAIVYLISAFIKQHYKKYGDSLVRFLCAGFYIYILINPETNLDTLRYWSRYFFFLLPVVEIVYWVARKFHDRRNKGQ